MTRATLIAALSLAYLPVNAAEHRGVVQFGGRPLPGVTVTATRGSIRRVTSTAPGGVYSFNDLADGIWTVRLEMQCFATVEREVLVGPGAPVAEWEMNLLPREQVSVVPATTGSQDAAPKSPKPERGDGKAPPKPANTTTSFQTADLRMAATSPPGADSDTLQPEIQDQARDGLLVNGSVNNGANTTLAQSPAFGNFHRFARSLYNGSLSFNVGASPLDARPFSLTGQDTRRAPYRYLTGSVNFGGPAPLFGGWRKSVQAPYFYINYQWTRNTNASMADGLMPQAGQRGGDFSNGPNFIRDPANGEPFPENRIPESRISQQAAALLWLYPLPDAAAVAGYNYQVPLLKGTHSDRLSLYLTKMLGKQDTVSGSLAYNTARGDTPSILGLLDTSLTTGFDSRANWSRLFRQTWRSQLALGVKRQSARTTPYFADRENVSGEAGIAGNNQDPANWGPPALSFISGITPLSDAASFHNRNQSLSAAWSVTGTVRRHNLTFGGGYTREQFNLLGQQNARGSFGFDGAFTGSDFADFLLGLAATSSVAFGNADKYFRSDAAYAFMNDDWRVSAGITINAGLRWEFLSPAYELYGRLVNLDIPPGFAAEAPVVAADPVGALTGSRYPASLIRPDVRFPQPRLAIAWRPATQRTVVVRASFGIYTDTSVYPSLASQMAQQWPLSKSLAVQNPIADPFTMADAFGGAPGFTPDTFAVDPRFRPGYAQTWQASVQRDLPGGMVATAEYLGAKGTDAPQAVYPNTFPLGAANPCPSCPSGYEYFMSGANSIRHAGNFRVRRRLHHGLAMSFAYTLAKSIDDATPGSTNLNMVPVAQNWRDLRAERARSVFDQRHSFEFQCQYSTGAAVSAAWTGWRGSLARNWTLSAAVTAASGLPVTPIYPGPMAGTGFSGNLRPDYTGAPLYLVPAGLFLNPAAYAAPASGSWGNAGRDSITGPAQFFTNAGLLRSLRLSDRFTLDLRLNSTNPLNHVVYSAWNTVITSAQFGRAEAAGAMRQVRAGLSVRF